MRPILKYPGSKWNLSSWIISHMPEHESYLEPYFGSGAVFFGKKPSKIETINDVDGEIVNFFRVCRENPEELARAINLTPWSREELAMSRKPINCHSELPKKSMKDFEIGNKYTDNPVERARRTAVSCYMTYGSRKNSRSFRHTTGKNRNNGPDNAKLWGYLPETVMQVAQRLKNAQIENKPAIDLIRGYDGPEVLIYLDPPYVMKTRTLHGTQYDFEMTDYDHEELLNVIVKHSGKIILSGYDNDMYNDYLNKWEKRSIKSQIERGGSRTETIWMNFELGFKQMKMEV